jgi:hypothetical protein
MPRLAIVVPTVRVVDGDADHQSQSEEGVDQRLAELGGLAEFEIDMQRLRIERHVGKQHVVHFGDGPPQGVGNHRARFEFLKIHARMAYSSHNLGFIDAAFETDAQVPDAEESRSSTAGRGHQGHLRR